MMMASFRYALRRNWIVLRAMAWLPFALVFIGEAVKQANDLVDPFTAFRVFSVSIPNHCEGENPTIHVLRTSDGGPRGAWVSWFENSERPQAPVCPFYSRTITYKAKSDFLVATRLYDYFGDTGCRLPAGQWNGVLHWSFERPWHNSDEVEVATNAPFTVWPAASPRCKEVPLR